MLLGPLAEEPSFVTLLCLKEWSFWYKPKRRTPIINSTQPARKQNSTTKSTGMFLVYSKVKSDIKDEGPIDTSLIVPKMIYIKAPTIHE